MTLGGMPYAARLTSITGTNLANLLNPSTIPSRPTASTDAGTINESCTGNAQAPACSLTYPIASVRALDSMPTRKVERGPREPRKDSGRCAMIPGSCARSG